MAEPPLKLLIVDDEPLAVERLTMLCFGLEGIAVIGSARDGEAALDLLDRCAPDLLLLDIAMPRMDGVSLARALERRTVRPAVIFVTAYDHHAVDAFDVAAVDYLLKPVAAERLERAIARVRDARRGAARPPDEPDQLWVPHRSEMIRIPVAGIDRVEAERDYMRLHVGARSYLIHMTIAELEQRLDSAAFLRVHRSAIVRIDRIDRVGKDDMGNWFAELADGHRLRVGRTYRARLKALVRRDAVNG
ncbi:MAG: response regulator transcription factor [Sphingomonas sp.]|nr:response regulator transcription factor [Sphingomonas sp.]